MQKQKIKICHVASADRALRFLLFSQLKFLEKSGYDVYAVCPAGKFVKDIEEAGIKVKTIYINRGLNPFFHLVTLVRLFFYFKKEKFTIVHTHNPVPGLLGQLAAKFAGVPIIINTVHGFYFNENSSFLKRKFFVFIEKIAAKCSDLILSQNKEDVCTAIAEKISESGKIKYLGNGIDLKKFDKSRFSDDFISKKKEELGLDKNSKIICIVGRLVEEKGYFYLFSAFERVLEEFPDAKLVCIGHEEPSKKDGISQDIVKNYNIGKNTMFLGERTDMDELYPLMDIFVLPSFREGFPRSVLEASATERPIIATDIRGCREAVENKKTGILVPVKNAEKIAEAIIFLLKNPDKAREFGKNAGRKAKKEFDESRIFTIIEKEYSRLLKEKGILK